MEPEELAFYKKALERVAACLGILTPLELVVQSREGETYADVLIRLLEQHLHDGRNYLDLTNLVEYAYRFDDKPSQLWNYFRLVAERLGRDLERAEFARWATEGDPQARAAAARRRILRYKPPVRRRRD